MIEALQFYVSGFWTWAGITIGIAVCLQGAALLVAAITGQFRRW